MKQAAILGLIYGVISLLLVVIGLSISKDFFFSGKSMLLGLIVGFAVLIIGGRFFLRKIEDIDLSYGVAFKYLFVATLISSIIGMGGAAILYGNDDELKEAYIDYQKSTTEKAQRMVMNMTGASEAQIESELEKLQESFESGDTIDRRNPYSISMLPSNIATSLILGLIYALISAIFVRVKHPA